MVAEHLIQVLIKHGTDSFFYFDQAKLILELEEFYTDHDSALQHNTGFVCLALAALALGSQWTALQPKAAAPIMVGKDVERIGTACYTQARALIPDLDESLSLESVQAPLVLGVYLLPGRATGSLHMYLGLALRRALALDLHLDSGADMYSNHDKEIRSRLWWAIFSVERQVITRPIFFSHVLVSDISPQDIDSEAQSTKINRSKHYNSVSTSANTVTGRNPGVRQLDTSDSQRTAHTYPRSFVKFIVSRFLDASEEAADRLTDHGQTIRLLPSKLKLRLRHGNKIYLQH